jgi:hypothetical protein
MSGTRFRAPFYHDRRENSKVRKRLIGDQRCGLFLPVPLLEIGHSRVNAQKDVVFADVVEQAGEAHPPPHGTAHLGKEQIDVGPAQIIVQTIGTVRPICRLIFWRFSFMNAYPRAIGRRAEVRWLPHGRRRLAWCRDRCVRAR